MAAILIADDDPTIRSMFARALGAIADCHVVASGDEATTLLRLRRYDAVVLDLAMPQGDGYSVLAAVRHPESINHETLVFVVSADGTSATRVRALRERGAGGSLFLTKPVRLGTLTAVVGEALRRRLGRTSIPPPA
jgi:two-component system, NarL family, sensor histidine kinase BarA